MLFFFLFSSYAYLEGSRSISQRSGVVTCPAGFLQLLPSVSPSQAKLDGVLFRVHMIISPNFDVVSVPDCSKLELKTLLITSFDLWEDRF